MFLREWGQADRRHDKNTRVIIMVGAALSIVIANYFTKTSYLRIPGSQQEHWLIGGILSWCGVVFRFWAIQTLGKFL